MSKQVLMWGAYIAVFLVLPLVAVGLWNRGGKIDFKDEALKIVTSCSNFSEGELIQLGFSGSDKRDACKEANLALMKTAVDRCADFVDVAKDLTQDQYQFFTNQCVYHELSNSITLSNMLALVGSR